MNAKLPGARISLLLAAVYLSVLPAGCSSPGPATEEPTIIQTQVKTSGPLTGAELAYFNNDFFCIGIIYYCYTIAYFFVRWDYCYI